MTIMRSIWVAWLFDKMGLIELIIRKSCVMIEHLRSMAVFAQVIDHGSFRRAASTLGLSPSVVSHHVSQLEQQLGVTLLYRSTRQLSLTQDGRAFHLACRQMIDAAEKGLDQLADHTDTLAGELRVAVPAFLSATLFMEDAAAFASAHPKVRLNISFSDQVQDLMDEGFDLAIRIALNALPESSMRASKLVEIEGVLVASPRFMAERRKPTHPKDLEEMSWVLGNRTSVPFVDGNGQVVTLKLQPRIEIDSVHAARGFALEHLGLALLPTNLAREDIAEGRLVEVLPDWKIPTATAYAVWPPNAGRMSLSFRFVEFLRSQIQKHIDDGAMPKPRA